MANTSSTRIIMRSNSPTIVRSAGDIEISADEFLLGYARGKIEIKADLYLWLFSNDSGLLLTPEQIQMSAPDIYLASTQNEVHPIFDDQSTEMILARYEEERNDALPVIAPDGNFIRRERYGDLLSEYALYMYFLENVLDKAPGFRTDDHAAIPTMYQQWLDETYGKTKLGELWDYLLTIDGLQDMIDALGIFVDAADFVNMIIYGARGKWGDVGLLDSEYLECPIFCYDCCWLNNIAGILCGDGG